MDPDSDRSWKDDVGFTINYNSDEDLDASDVVIRNPWRSASHLLADDGDGAEADLFGTTPPRTRILTNAKKKSLMDSDFGSRTFRRVSYDQQTMDKVASPDRVKKRSSVKLWRSRERDWKQDIEQKLDSAPLNPPDVLTLVESCNRFMSLTSRLKCREAEGERRTEEVEGQWGGESCDSRVNFHKTFCMLINMGNIDKNCKRSISREEQVWQNERKDLIWLELRAKIAGRTLAQQDAYLCAQRQIVPVIIKDILEYKFVNPNPCKGETIRLCEFKGSQEDLVSEDAVTESDVTKDYDILFGCLSMNCQLCSDAISAALRDVRALLERYHAALALYPSGNALTHDHPLVATDEFKNRLNAMCVWYNVALHLRHKVLAVRRVLRAMQHKEAIRNQHSMDLSRESSMEPKRPCQVTFASNNNSNNSDSSVHSKEEENDRECSSDEQEKVVANEYKKTNEVKQENEKIDEESDEVDHEIDKLGSLPTPEIVVSDSQYSTADTADTADSAGSAGSADTAGSARSARSAGSTRSADSGLGAADDALDVGPLEDLVKLRLLGKCDVSPYRQYHSEKLKTQGVRRSMMFIHKIRKHLNKAYLTFDKLDDPQTETEETQGVDLFVDTRVEDDKVEAMDRPIDETQEYELRRYGCWSEECLAMCLPSYRNHFLLLTSICMEAVHDYLSLRLEDRPERLSCLTVKQLIHELKEGLETARLVRASFARHVRAALRGLRAQRAARADLRRLRAGYDRSVHTVLKQYLSYLRTMSLTEHVPRAALDAEWAFTARLAHQFPCAALLAPLYFTDIACNQLKRIQDQIEKNMQELEEPQSTAEPEDMRLQVYAACRLAQHAYAGEREAALQAAQGARALAARLARPHPHRHNYLDQRARIFESLMSIRSCVVRHAEHILQRSRAGALEPRGLAEQVAARVRELLLQLYKLAFEIHKELHRFVSGAGTGAGAAGAGPRGRLLRADSVFGEHDDMFDNDHHEKQNSIERLLWEQQAPSGEEKEGGEGVGAGAAEGAGSREGAAGAGEGAGATEGGALEGQWAARAARAVTQLARCWMGFVIERYDRGRGLRPRWASQGLEFLTLACDPCNTKHLTDEEFEELKQLMDQCISHVVGSRPSSNRTLDPAASPTPRRHRQRSPLPGAGDGSPREPTTPVTPALSCDRDPLGCLNELEQDAHTRRVLRAIHVLEDTREEKLHNMKTVGKVMEAAVASYEPKLRQVTFKWQRGLKIGAGTFGKVYTVVNTETGQLLAMKEISVVAGDRRALQRAAHELRVLEGLVHPHLVRYYGCEVHREEMLIFMELCVEGSLEALVAGGGALGEPTARRYTRQLLSAVLALHSRNIAHRDIKSGNIFLTNEGHCLKLGDFGCAVKIRANTTAAGELQGYVGTQAYMAPEVFMKSSGHGRAADIWSLGCVVTEMTSGKRPFSEYDSNYQIMFVVGMGGRPAAPAALSAEGADFCARCLAHEPARRARAEDLMDHLFLKIKSDDDCKCQPGVLVTPSTSRED